ncbi:type II toxin-antitoxin system VapC family toxin [Archaeoglobus sp.]
MKRVYLDTSAYLKEFSQEKGSKTISRIFSACERGEVVIVTSQWTLSESIAAVDRKCRRGEINPDERDTVIATILNKTMELVRNDNLVLVPVTSQLVQASWRVILERHVSADDSIHLVSALVTLSEIFVAADDYLIERAREEEFDSYDVEELADCKKLEETLGV